MNKDKRLNDPFDPHYEPPVTEPPPPSGYEPPKRPEPASIPDPLPQ